MTQSRGGQPPAASRESLTDQPSSPIAKTLGTVPPSDESTASYTPLVRECLEVAGQMDRVRDAVVVDRKVEELTRKLSMQDAVQLEEVAATTGRTHNARYLAVYMLGQRPETFARQLEELGRSENGALTRPAQTHSLAEVERHFEEALRFQALAALDTLNAKDSREERFFSNLQATSSSPFIRKLGGMGSVGARSGKSLINQYLNVKR